MIQIGSNRFVRSQTGDVCGRGAGALGTWRVIMYSIGGIRAYGS